MDLQSYLCHDVEKPFQRGKASCMLTLTSLLLGLYLLTTDPIVKRLMQLEGPCMKGQVITLLHGGNSFVTAFIFSLDTS